MDAFGVHVFRRTACIPDATLLAYRPHQDQLCQFKVGGVTFVVYETWGDSDRDWVG